MPPRCLANVKTWSEFSLATGLIHILISRYICIRKLSIGFKYNCSDRFTARSDGDRANSISKITEFYRVIKNNHYIIIEPK